MTTDDKKKAASTRGVPPTPGGSTDVSVTIRLPRSLHARLTHIGASDGKTVNALLLTAAREHAASYKQVTKTVVGYARKTP